MRKRASRGRVNAVLRKLQRELVQLEMGLKRALKVEHVDPSDEAALREVAATRAWSVVADEEPTPSYVGRASEIARTLYAGPDRALLEALVVDSRLHRDPTAESGAKLEAIRRTGAELGYPPCCVERYLAGHDFADQSLVLLRPAFGTQGVPSSLLNLATNDELISHVPCSYACAPSMDIARRTLAELEQRDAVDGALRRARLQLAILVLGARGIARLAPAPGFEVRHDRLRYDRVEIDGLDDAELGAALLRGDELVLGVDSWQVLRAGAPVYTGRREAPLDLPLLIAFDGPARRALRVALVDLHRSRLDYMDTLSSAMMSGDLRHLGVETRAIRLYVDREHPEGEGASLRRLGDFLIAGGEPLVIWNMAFDADVVARVRESGARQVLVDPRFDGQRSPFDFVLTAPGRRAMTRSAREWNEGRDVPRVAELLRRTDDGWRGAALVARLPPEGRVEDATFWPDVHYVVPEGEWRPDADAWHLCVNPGCPYGKRLDDNAHFAGLALPSGTSARGCSFCEEGGDYEGAPAGPTLDSLIHQLAYIVARAPHARFILLERAVFRFLARFLRRAHALLSSSGRTRGRPEFYVTARTDELVREEAHLREALDVAREVGLDVRLYLVGFENFSQIELDRFNKGVSVETQLAALAVVHRLEAAYADVFSATREASHGFLLFTPWTTLDDLKINAQHLRATRFWELRSEATLSKLRLNPVVPLYHKARAEGLLDGVSDFLDMSERLGYSQEVAWRFLHADVAAVHRLISSEEAHYPRGRREVDLLDAAIATVERDGPAVDVAEFRRAWRHSLPTRRGLGKLERRPVELALSHSCNLACTYCDRKSDAAAPPRAEQARLLLRSAASGRQVVLGGAEPLGTHDLLWGAAAARRAGYTHIVVETNALGIDAERLARLRAAGVTRLRPFIPAPSLAALPGVTREPRAAEWLQAAAAVVDASELEVQPVLAVAVETLPDLAKYVELVTALFPAARGLALRFFGHSGALATQRVQGSEQALGRLVGDADHAGLGVTQVGVPLVPPCAFKAARALRDLFVFDDGPAQRVPACEGCVLRDRCKGVDPELLRRHPDTAFRTVTEWSS